ncbi:MAG: ABC transporter family substrate-binding protein [Micropruina sp.]|uniref:ABC transporter family substrate-binding protein n=1 Tax=Micropruina sp. TaxID=2737536 RepID=UPI0039E30EC9
MTVLGLAACGGPAQPNAPTAGSTATAVKSGWDINETPRDQLVGGEFIGAISHEYRNWNPYTSAGGDAEMTFLEKPISPAYYDYDAEGNPKINNDYLLDAKEEVNPNLKLTLTLNPKAVWNDGTPITVKDWIATWKALNGSDKKYKNINTAGWELITSVAAGADDYEVVLTFKTTYPDWTKIIAGGPFRAESVATPELFNDGWTKGMKLGWQSGPFKIDSIDNVSGTTIMVPNERWWGAKPLLTKLTFKKILTDAQATAFANQELDYYDMGSDPNGFKTASDAQNSVVRKAAGPNFRHFTFNAKAPNLTDVKVRQAIMMGLDRGAIGRSDLAGIAWDATPLNNTLYMANQTGYVDQGKATGIDYNVEGAKAKLDEAGWTLNASTGFREKDGKQLDVNFVVLSGVSASENEGLQAQKMLKEIGVNLKLKNINVDKQWPGVLNDHGFDIIAFSWIGTPYPLGDLRQIYGASVKDGKESYEPFNYAQLLNPTVEELAPKIDTEMDPAKRAEMGNQVARSIWESGHTLPLYQRPMLIGVRAKLANIGAVAFGTIKWENVGYTK